MAQISGLVSGLDTASIIDALMNVAKLPQLQLNDKKTDLTKVITALQGVNARTSSLADNAAKAANPASWNVLSATSSAASVTATAGTTAGVTSVSFTVDKVAQSQISLSSTFSDISELTGGGSTLSLKVGDQVTQIDVSGITSPADLAAAISRSGAGVSASVTSSADGYRLQLTGQSTGADQAFTLYAGDADEVEAGTASQVSLVTARAAQDAQLTLWAGTPAAQTVTSSSNTFTSLLTGLDVTVTKVETDPVTIDVASDTAALTKLGSNLISQLNQVLGEISTQTATSSTTGSSGSTVVTGGVLSGNSGIRMLADNLARAGSLDVDGVSPSSIGITINKDGTFTFDEAKFTEALAADPSKVQSMLSAIADRVNTVAVAASDKYEGTLTQQINSSNDQVKDLSDRISNWDTLLTARRAALEAQWANLETSLSKLNAQSSWLTSITAALPSTSSSSKSS